MANLFDEEQGSYLRMNALKYLEKPPEVQREDDPFITNGSLAITYILIENVEQFRAGEGLKFQPSYVHQVFRETNEIYGYKDLKITIYVTALGLKPYIKIEYSELVEDADDLNSSFNKVYEAGYLTKEQEFIATLEEEKDQEPIGELIEQYDDFKIYMSQSPNTKGLVEFKPFVQAFLIILIDGIQYPKDDEHWIYLTLYKNKHFIGLTTVFQFNLSLNKQRYRLSQMLFLPQFQRKGHGSKMLQAVYKLGLQNDKCLQITLEDPSDDFQVMRDITDCKMLSQYFRDLLPNQIINSPDELGQLAKDKLFEIMSKTKLHPQQIKRAYQIYQYSFLNKKSHKLMVEFAKHLTKDLEKPYNRKKNILVRFEDGSSLSKKQLHLLQMKEKEDRNINYEEALGDEFCLYELIATKLRKDKII